MQKKPNISADAAELRRRAEGRLRGQRKSMPPPRTDADTQRLLHELQVHQIELEIQNAELLEARDQMEAMLEKYTDLYDFAPVGYFSIDEQGLIFEVNLTGAALLGSERKWCRVAVSDITAIKQAEETQRRVEALDAANRELKQEIVRRKAVETALKKSERYSSRLLARALGLQKQLQRLFHRVLQAQEGERKRISRELHDDVAQVLTAISFHLAVLKKEVTPS